MTFIVMTFYFHPFTSIIVGGLTQTLGHLNCFFVITRDWRCVWIVVDEVLKQNIKGIYSMNHVKPQGVMRWITVNLFRWHTAAISIVSKKKSWSLIGDTLWLDFRWSRREACCQTTSCGCWRMLRKWVASRQTTTTQTKRMATGTRTSCWLRTWKTPGSRSWRASSQRWGSMVSMWNG